MSNNHNPAITDGLSENEGTQATVNIDELQERIINDIREMDTDNFSALVEHLYPVKVTDTDGENIELIVDEASGHKYLKEIF